MCVVYGHKAGHLNQGMKRKEFPFFCYFSRENTTRILVCTAQLLTLKAGLSLYRLALFLCRNSIICDSGTFIDPVCSSYVHCLGMWQTLR